MRYRLRGLLIGTALLLAACSGQTVGPSARVSEAPPDTSAPLASDAPVARSSSPLPTSPAFSPTQPPSVEAGGLAPDRAASVVTDDLVVRSLPEISAASVIDPVTLSDGDLLFVLDGPVMADGFDWYHVAAFEEFPDDTPYPLPNPGWVAAGKAGEAWIAPWPGECPAPKLEDFWRVPSLLLLACFGREEMAFEGTLHACSYTVPGYITPAWLVHELCEIRPDVPSDAFSLRSGFFVHQEEEDVPAHDSEGQTVRVTGHFDDPAARTCIEDTLTGEEPTPPARLVLFCRAQFVATDITRLDQP